MKCETGPLCRINLDSKVPTKIVHRPPDFTFKRLALAKLCLEVQRCILIEYGPIVIQKDAKSYLSPVDIADTN